MLKKNLFGDTEAYLIFDDTVINNLLLKQAKVFIKLSMVIDQNI